MYTLRPVWSRIGGVLVSVMIATAGISPTIAYSAEAPDKSETVHVNTDAQGSVTSIDVDELLANNDAAKQVVDRTTLTDIKPSEDNQAFSTAQDGSLTWITDGKSVQYEGTSTEEPPVKVKVAYTLDGKTVRPEDLAGASGHLVVHIDYENTLSSVREIDGKQARIYTPFLCMTAALLDGDIFTNVTATNARVIDDKGGLAVIGYAVPGLRESLDIDPDDFDLDLPDYLQIEADVTDLTMDPLYTLVTPELFSDIDTSDLDFGDLGEGTDELQDAMAQLIDGSGTLSDALHKLADGSDKLSGGASALQEALGALPTGISKLRKGASSLAKGLDNAAIVAGKLGTGATGLSEAAKDASDLMSGASTKTGEATEAVTELKSQVDALDLDETKQTMDDAASAAGSAQNAASEAKGLLDESLNKTATQKEATRTKIDAAKSALGDVATVLDDESLALTPEQREAIAGALAEKVTAVQSSLEDASGALEAIPTAAPEGLAEKTTALADATQQLSDDASSLTEASAKVTAVGDGADVALQKLGETTGALAGASAYADGVAKGAEDLNTGITGLAGGIDGAAEGAKALAKGMRAMAKQAPKAVKGVKALAKGADQLTSAIDATAQGSDQLTEGLSTFNDEGIAKLVDALDDLDRDLSGVTDRIEALRDAAKAYDNFAGKAEGQSGSVRFIYKTEQIG